MISLLLVASTQWPMHVRALALGNANAKCKGYLVFQAPKCIALGNAIAKYCKFFCNSATV